MTRFLAPRSFGPGGLSQDLPVDFLERLRSGTLLASRVAGEMRNPDPLDDITMGSAKRRFSAVRDTLGVVRRSPSFCGVSFHARFDYPATRDARGGRPEDL